jgi:hypothetical protein
MDGAVRHADGSGHGTSLKNDLDRLNATLVEISDVALVIIDPITAYLGDADSRRDAGVIHALIKPSSRACGSDDMRITSSIKLPAARPYYGYWVRWRLSRQLERHS